MRELLARYPEQGNRGHPESLNAGENKRRRQEDDQTVLVENVKSSKFASKEAKCAQQGSSTDRIGLENLFTEEFN